MNDDEMNFIVTVTDYLDFDDSKKLITVPELRQEQPNRNCLCKGPACVCCVDFNITFVDLGGPGRKILNILRIVFVFLPVKKFSCHLKLELEPVTRTSL